MKIPTHFVVCFMVVAAPTSSSLRAQGCVTYYPSPPPSATVEGNGVVAPASGSQTTTETKTGLEFCANSTTSTEPVTSGFFVMPGYLTANFGTIPGTSIQYANNVPPTPFVVCNGQVATQGTGQVSRPTSIPPETFTSTISGTTLTETEVDASPDSVQTSTSVFDVTTGVQQLTLVSTAYISTPAPPGGGCTDTVSSSTTISGTFVWQVAATPLPQQAVWANAVNPLAAFVGMHQAPAILDPHTVSQAPAATSVVADRVSAVVLVFQSSSAEPATVTLSTSGSAIPNGTSVGGLTLFDPAYLVTPNPPSGKPQMLSSVLPIDSDTCADTGGCTFLVLLWGPTIMPTTDASTVTLAATFAQSDSASLPVMVTVGPPPLLLVHGIWSSPQQAGFTRGSNGLYDFIETLYQNELVFPVDYSNDNYKSFDDPAIQTALADAMADALTAAANQGVAARTVDVVAHSMGGLATRYFLSTGGYSVNPALFSKPVHELITIGTPHQGTPIATTLVANQGQTSMLANPIVNALCPGSCTLGSLMALIGKRVDTGAQSLQPAAPQLQDLGSPTPFNAIVGEAPARSVTESLLDALIGAFLPAQTVGSILGPANDTIVPATSQTGGAPACIDGQGSGCSVAVSGIVHTSLCQLPVVSSVCTDTGETQSTDVWTQAFEWLTGPGVSPANSPNAPDTAHPRPRTTAGSPSPNLNLTGYTQVAASNVTIMPATASVLTINKVTNITATSSAKTITELLLLQTVADPTDTVLLFATQAPFTVAFTPTRLGSATLAAVTVFNDSTYAVTPLNYTFQPGGNPINLTLSNLPVASMSPGDSRVAKAIAQFDAGPVDVTAVATYTSASGTTNVFQSGAGGTITAIGKGVDVLNVSYGGLTATAPITAGVCTYSLSPMTQLVPYTGGSLAVQVTAPAGCAWTAGGGAPWLTLNNISGAGSGSIALTAVPNSTGSAQFAGITVAGSSAAFTQPATSCTYILSQRQINAPQTGATGTITATTPCPVTVSSDSNWVTPYNAGTSESHTVSVSYTVAANSGPARSAILTIGTATVAVNQAAGPALMVALTHAGSLFPGEDNAVYLATVSNEVSAASTSATVAVTEDLPPGLALESMSGTGWTCTPGGTGCTRSDALAAGASYPPIAVMLNVASNVFSSITNQVIVAGGGSSPASASNVATVTPFSPCDINKDGSTNVSDVQTVINEALGAAPAVNDLSGSGVVSVLDVQIVIDAVLRMGCSAA